MRLVIVSFLLIACAINAQAQQVRLTGVVEDSLSVPLSSAHVFIQQQKRKTVTTNSKGEFFVDLTKGFFKLEITYTGYQKFSANLNISGD
ncbi:MAG: carboxypeptidase-like regulatory domain-containing protein, partial [Cyclobacteriaceae bacterium]